MILPRRPAQVKLFFLGRTKDATRLLKKIPSVWNLFAENNIKYTSRHPPEGHFISGINKTHKTWQECFETEDKQKVESICKDKKFACTWHGNWLEVVRIAPSLRPDPDHPEELMWFNQAYLYHPNHIIRGGWVNHILASLLYIWPHTRNYDVSFENGKQIPLSVLKEVYKTMDEVTIKFDWQKGDVLIVDNIRALHGRASYVGNRKILAAMIRKV